jgi:hypothetical protein
MHRQGYPWVFAEKILTSRVALDGERKQVTMLFADLKGSMRCWLYKTPSTAAPTKPALYMRLPCRSASTLTRGRWVVRAIGQTTHLAAPMEQLATLAS